MDISHLGQHLVVKANTAAAATCFVGLAKPCAGAWRHGRTGRQGMHATQGPGLMAGSAPGHVALDRAQAAGEVAGPRACRAGRRGSSG